MKNSFGSFLKQKRKEKNLTQKELASLLYVTESAVSKWEKDVAHPDITLLPKLSAILGVTEHEIITASIDEKNREEKKQAKKWRTLTVTWDLFFIISYSVALLTCFVCNLAIDKTLSWFWIVLSSLILAFTVTNLPGLIKKHKLIFIPLSIFLALCILLAVCAIYTGGKWFFIPVLAVLFTLLAIFMPIYIAKYDVFDKIRKFNDFISIAIDFITLNFLLLVINAYTEAIGSTAEFWYFNIAFPIVLTIYLIVNLLLCVRFIKINKLLKTSIVLNFINFILYLIPPFIKTENADLQKEIDDANIFKANLLNWDANVTLENNIHLLTFLTLLVLGVIFLIFGLIKHIKSKKTR